MTNEKIQRRQGKGKNLKQEERTKGTSRYEMWGKMFKLRATKTDGEGFGEKVSDGQGLMVEMVNQR